MSTMAPAAGDRLLTRPLAVFLLAVAALLGGSLATRPGSPDLDGAIAALADGDLDGAARRDMLRHVVDLARDAEPPRHRWAGLLAAVALQDREAFAALEARLGEGPGRALPAAERAWVGLGDTLLANMLDAMGAEAAADRDAARRRWQQVAAQARLTGNAHAAELAAAAQRRLG